MEALDTTDRERASEVRLLPSPRLTRDTANRELGSEMAEDTTPDRPRLTKSGVARIATILVTMVVQAAVFFAAAGQIDIPRAWVYYGVTLVYFLIALPMLLLLFPQVLELVNERGKLKKDTKTWDKVWGVLYGVLLFVIPVVAGLDVGRLGGPDVSAAFVAPCLVVTILGYALVHWAMVVNTYAELGVRIQRDRGQEVVSTGPYRYVRHPFYVSVIVTQLVYPAALGSLLAYVPVAVLIALVVWRTAMEDRTLQAELPGYVEYTKHTRYRLLPGVW
jgi:protein-S-isoprenylcysteine O-methyltransferase Ste14